MNVICLMGRLTEDPELRHTQSQNPVTSFSIAVDRAYQPKGAEQRQADFIHIVAWRHTAEFICRYFRKGQRMALQGELQSRQYTDRDGAARTAWEVVADQVFFAETKKDAQGAGAPDIRRETPPPTYAEPQDFEEIPSDDDLPF